jgi:hypothetical protein
VYLYGDKEHVPRAKGGALRAVISHRLDQAISPQLRLEDIVEACDLVADYNRNLKARRCWLLPTRCLSGPVARQRNLRILAPTKPRQEA